VRKAVAYSQPPEQRAAARSWIAAGRRCRADLAPIEIAMA
jgi:hypothetical protein